jgi:hypothetical protein
MAVKQSSADTEVGIAAGAHHAPPQDRATPGTMPLIRSTAIKLQPLITPFGPSEAHLMRQWLVQAKSENFPNCWHNRERGQRAHQWAYTRMGHDWESHP